MRLATEDDAPAVLGIYAPIVEETVISFEMAPPTVDEMRARIRLSLSEHAWIVSENEGVVDAYAYGSTLRTRAAYRWAVETAVYVAADRRGTGTGKRTYRALLALLEVQGYVSAFGGITLPNPASVRLHESLGFAWVGAFPRVGYKFGAWHDVGFWRRSLSEPAGEPAPPRRLAELQADEVARALAC